MPIHNSSRAALWRAVSSCALFIEGTGSCGVNDIPPDLQPTVDARLPLAISLAKGVADHCSDYEAGEASAPPASPAVGTALGTDLRVVEILVRCSWPRDGDQASQLESGHEFNFPALRKAERRSHSPPPRLIYDNFVKQGDPDFERVYVPSLYSDDLSSIDIIVRQPTPGGARSR